MSIRTFLLMAGLAGCGVDGNLTPQPDVPVSLPACVPNRDGAITADELPIALGATSTYYTGTGRAFDAVGTVRGDTRVYDLSQELPDDVVIELGPTALGAQWYAASFTQGQFTVAAGSGLDGIYHQDAQALWLDGIASHDESPPAGKTLVRYPQPLPVLRFPIVEGLAYTVTAAIPDGIIAGLPFIGTDELSVDVSGTGRLDLPYVRFSPVLRVRTRVTRKPSTGTPVITKRTTLWLFECFGELARAESNPNEPDPDFTTASYLRRFALGGQP